MPSAQRLRAAIPQKSTKAKKRKVKNPKSKKRKGINLIFLIVFVLILAGIGYVSWRLYFSWVNRHWITGARMTVIVGKENPKIYSYNPQTKKITTIEIPANTEIEAANGYGTWLAGGLWGLGQQEKLEGGLLKNSIQKSLGIPVDAWIEEKGEKLFEKNALGFFEAAIGAMNTGKIQTNLTFFDRLGLLTKSVGTGSTDRKEINLVQSGVLKKTKLSDSTEGYIIIPEKAKVVFSEMSDDLIYTEAQKVVIVNTTSKSGLATTVAQTASILGTRVINTKNVNDDVDDCLIRTKSESRDTLTVKRFVQIFGCDVENIQTKSTEDIEIVLGRKFAERY